jgi:para-nitrobenzyl esterase
MVQPTLGHPAVPFKTDDGVREDGVDPPSAKEHDVTDPIVTTTAGAVRGRWRTDDDGNASAAFLGIPFAEPPVGRLRFEAPVPHAPWEGVHDAGEMGATPQRRPFAEVTSIPEPSFPGDSTLNVNVFTPSPEASTDPLPVLVWIHGGGFIAGSPASPWYDGRAFNRDGVVTVTISYRLGFDGFGWIPDAPSNRGVRDWLLALEWVQQNVAAFGGDPGRVTIAGQSAGGGAVLHLLAMEQAQHLFHRVLAISPSAPAVSTEVAERIARTMAELSGVEPTKAGFSTIPDDELRDLFDRAANAGTGRLEQVRGLLAGSPSGPMLDGDLVPRPVAESIAHGIGTDKPLVLGATDEEFAGAVAPFRNALRFVPARVVLRALGLTARVGGPYIRANLDIRARGVAATAGRYVTDVVFRAPALQVARNRADAPTWLYRFAWRSGVSGLAEHCLDIPFWFDCLADPQVAALAGPAAPEPLATEMHSAAVAFIGGGDPGWPVWDPATRTDRAFGDPSVTESNGFAGAAPLIG